MALSENLGKTSANPLVDPHPVQNKSHLQTPPVTLGVIGRLEACELR